MPSVLSTIGPVEQRLGELVLKATPPKATRDLKVVEVDVGCDACEGARCSADPRVTFIAGVMLGIARDQLSFCSKHYAGFKHAMGEMSAPNGCKDER